MKKLVLEAVYIPQFSWYAVRVVEQTHRNTEFGCDGDTYCRSGVSPMKLCSIAFPQGISEENKYAFFVRGSNKLNDNDVVTVPAAQMDNLRKIVKEYNREFSVPAFVQPEPVVEYVR